MFSPRRNRPQNILETDEEDFSDDPVSARKDSTAEPTKEDESKDQITGGSKKINVVDNLVDSAGITPNEQTQETGALKHLTGSRVSPLGELKDNAGPVLPDNENS